MLIWPQIGASLPLGRDVCRTTTIIALTPRFSLLSSVSAPTATLARIMLMSHQSASLNTMLASIAVGLFDRR